MVNGLPDATRVVFDDERVVANAGVLLPAVLADRLGIEALVDRDGRSRRSGRGGEPGPQGDELGVGDVRWGRTASMTATCCARGRRGRCSGMGWRRRRRSGRFCGRSRSGMSASSTGCSPRACRRAWAAGAGPGDERLVVDVDSFVGEVYGYDKQGAGYGYTHKRGYHPIVATRAGTGEVLHIRARKGSANTSRGALRFVEELIPRVARAGATGPKLLRADSGFWNQKIMARLRARGLDLLDRGPPAAPRQGRDRGDPRAGLAAARRLPRRRGGADRADDARPPAADRAPHPPGRRPGRAVARLAPLTRS